MSTLMRAPWACASWEWDLDEYAPPGLEPALSTASLMCATLGEYGLLEPASVTWPWFAYGRGGLGITTQLPLRGKLDVAELADQIMRSRPVGYSDAKVGNMTFTGPGTWIDASGTERQEPGLIELSIDPDERHLSADVSVFHDIWGKFTFGGIPQAEVHRRNAPRLAAALQSLDDLLGTKAEPGEATYFGRAEGHGIEDPDVIEGRGPDLTDRL